MVRGPDAQLLACRSLGLWFKLFPASEASGCSTKMEGRKPGIGGATWPFILERSSTLTFCSKVHFPQKGQEGMAVFLVSHPSTIQIPQNMRSGEVLVSLSPSTLIQAHFQAGAQTFQNVAMGKRGDWST